MTDEIRNEFDRLHTLIDETGIQQQMLSVDFYALKRKLDAALVVLNGHAEPASPPVTEG